MITAGHTFHALYVTVHTNHKLAPATWTAQKCTDVLTGAMAGEKSAWPVVGITKAALQKFAAQDFRRRSGMGVTRAHLYPRIATVRALLAPAVPVTEDVFLATWLQNDKVVLVDRGENRSQVPAYIPFCAAAKELFTTTYIAWRHRQPEQDYLRNLYASTTPRPGVPIHITVMAAFKGSRLVYYWFASEQNKEWTLEEITATQQLHGPFDTQAAADAAAQKTLVGDACQLRDGGMWDKAWERKQ